MSKRKRKRKREDTSGGRGPEAPGPPTWGMGSGREWEKRYFEAAKAAKRSLTEDTVVQGTGRPPDWVKKGRLTF
jgi:hypothetical protein